VLDFATFCISRHLGRLSFPLGLVSPSIGRGWWKMDENRPGNREVAAASAVQIPHELPSIYRWVANDVLGALSILDQRYLDELKATRILFGGGGLEQRYRVEAAVVVKGFVT
ncbi:hypothetical protein PIB30_085069, partial [Stylosanthes scabra]|nr:hypothetical protein [Stylosanthes scabra]